MEQVLNNPVYHGLTTGDRHLSFGTDHVKFFDEKVSPFAGFDEGHEKGFEELYEALPPGRNILYAIPRLISQPEGWLLVHEVRGVQFVYEGGLKSIPPNLPLVPLERRHIEQMVDLARLTRPGPFGTGTINFGHYYGIFDGKKLVAMTGQRLHPGPYSEVSAVCTHPDYLGRGYGAALVQYQANLIQEQGQIPFLHVREDNNRAIELYERLGFRLRGPMNFYFMKRQSHH